jgi:coproporphyrinogen III oxidase
VAYGVIIFGKVRISSAPGKYIFVRWFGGGEDSDPSETEYKFHSIYTEEKLGPNGSRAYRAVMEDSDELFFFNE